jgi:hypothetical protein
VKQGLKDEPARTHPKEEGTISHEQTDQPSQARSVVQTGQDHLAPHQQEHFVAALFGKATKGPEHEGILDYKDAEMAHVEVKLYPTRAAHPHLS